MKRCPENPLIRPDTVRPSAPEYRVRGAFNPGAVRFGDEILLLLRVAEDCVAPAGAIAVPFARFGGGAGGRPDVLTVSRDDPDLEIHDSRGLLYRGNRYLSTMSHIRLARSPDGVRFTVDEEPFMFPAVPGEEFGVEDARVVEIDGAYYINYTSVSGDGWATSLAVTRDFRTIERLGTIFHPENKDVALFPRPHGGLYRTFHRPNNSFGKPSIWYAESPDLRHWGNHRCVLRPRPTRWEAKKIGGGAPALETADGWLHVYHGKGADDAYSLAVLLLDREHPYRILRQSVEPVLVPETDYERRGFFGNVVFTNGIVPVGDGRLLVYYGAADESTCLAESSVEELLDATRSV